MIRYYTANRDALIYKELRRGKDPKEIRMRLNLSSTDIVYKAMARYRRMLPVTIDIERRRRHLNLPKIANKSIGQKGVPAHTIQE